MNSMYLKTVCRNSTFRQIFQCQFSNGNLINNNQDSQRSLCHISKLQSSIFSRLLDNDILKNCKKIHKFPILYNEQIKKAEGDKKVGLAEELLTATLKANSPPIEDDETRKQKQEEKERSMRALKFGYITFGGMILISAGIIVWAYGCPTKDEKGNIIVDEFSEMPILKQYICRTYSELKNMNRMIQEPSSHKLLPDVLSLPYFQPPFTLVLEMTDLLVHPEWTYQSGWRFKKRPGVDFLLHHCAPPHFEIVLYTNEQAFTAHPVVEQLDPSNIIWYRLYKDATRYENGKHFKDLYCLNRNLNKVIAVDWNKDASTSPRNTLKIKRWDGNMNDSTLMDLAIMVRTIAESEVGDVREVLEYYNTFDDPIAKFKENHRLALQREKEKDNKPQRKSLLSNVGKLK